MQVKSKEISWVQHQTVNRHLTASTAIGVPKNLGHKETNNTKYYTKKMSSFMPQIVIKAGLSSSHCNVHQKEKSKNLD